MLLKIESKYQVDKIINRTRVIHEVEAMLPYPFAKDRS